jgi:alpha-tubulin suppressor-like RCC1 family protein
LCVLLCTYTYTSAHGQIGVGNRNDAVRPVQLPKSAFNHETIKQVACGNLTTSFLTVAGDIWICGNTASGRGWTDHNVQDFFYPTKVALSGLQSITVCIFANLGITSKFNYLTISSNNNNINNRFK